MARCKPGLAGSKSAARVPNPYPTVPAKYRFFDINTGDRVSFSYPTVPAKYRVSDIDGGRVRNHGQDKKPTVEETVMILYPAVPAHLQIFVLDDVPDKRVTLEAAHRKAHKSGPRDKQVAKQSAKPTVFRFLHLSQELKDKIYDIIAIDLAYELFAKRDEDYEHARQWTQFCPFSSPIRLANKQVKFEYSSRIAYRSRFHLKFRASDEEGPSSFSAGTRRLPCILPAGYSSQFDGPIMWDRDVKYLPVPQGLLQLIEHLSLMLNEWIHMEENDVWKELLEREKALSMPILRTCLYDQTDPWDFKMEKYLLRAKVEE